MVAKVLKKRNEDDADVVWQAIPGTSQEFAICAPVDCILYHGTRGPGKTITQLMHFRQFVGRGYGAYWRGILIDVEYKNFTDIINQSKRFFYQFDDGAKFYESASDLKWVWPTGEQLLLRNMKVKSDYDKIHGHEYPWIGFNELTKHATPDLHDMILSTNRCSFLPEEHTPMRKRPDGKPLKDRDGNIIYDTHDGKPLPPIPLIEFSTTNPSGPGHNWVKKRFIKCAEDGQIVRTTTKVFDPRSQKEVDVVRKQVAIFGSYKENIYLDAKYIAQLDEKTRNNPNLYAAWIEGSWDITAGGAVDDIWDKSIHILPRFRVPYEWPLDRAFDWGSTHPFCNVWFAESDGKTPASLPDGRTFCPPAGTLIGLADWYGTEDIGSNKGIKMSAKNVARGIKKREINMLEYKWIVRQPYPGPADNQINNVNEVESDTIAETMSNEGIDWEDSDKSPGSRKMGLQLIRDALENAVNNEEGGLYFMENCDACINTIPVLPRDEDDPDDVDTTAEDHPYDAVRYRMLKGRKRLVGEDFSVSHAH